MNLYCIALVALAALPATLARAQTAADEDFDARCSGPGVVKCVGFNNTTTDIVQGANLNTDGAGVYRAVLDTEEKASGAGSLRFDLPPPPHAGANIAGSWSPRSNDGLGRLFGQDSTFYVQFRMRLSEGMLNNTWDSTWKTILLHYNQQTCGSIELTMVNYWLSNRPTMYTNCGATHMYTTLDGSQHTEDPPLLMQQVDYPCEYNRYTDETCYYFTADEWLTFYYKITIGTWDQPNSMIEAWVAREGDADYRQWIRVPDIELSCNTDPCTSAPGADQGYNNLTFTPYMTRLSSSSGLAAVTSRIWYDDLIVSTQPIPVPATGPRPEAPTQVEAE